MLHQVVSHSEQQVFTKWSCHQLHTIMAVRYCVYAGNRGGRNAGNGARHGIDIWTRYISMGSVVFSPIANAVGVVGVMMISNLESTSRVSLRMILLTFCACV